MDVAKFIAKWKKVELKERSAAQEHFIDLCGMVDHRPPAEEDPFGDTFCFEKGATKQGGGDGFADVWKKGFFGWEYKRKHNDLDEAYDQLLLYRDALANPPLLVVCDLDRIVVHTNFTNTVSATHEITLDKMGEPRSIDILRAVFFEPDKLRPEKTTQAITQEVAEQFAAIAASMCRRGLDSAKVAHFLDRIVFCFFAEDIGLLPNKIFTRILENSLGDPSRFTRQLQELFKAMMRGGDFGVERIRHFNGSLFNDTSVLLLSEDEMGLALSAARLDWSAIDPSIFGTLFERGLDPDKRSQLGAHFTSKEDIQTLVEAVVMQPLRRDWTEIQKTVNDCLAARSKRRETTWKKQRRSARPDKATRDAENAIHRFLDRLGRLRILDPACGSGNFLYVALQALKDLEKDVIVFSREKGLGEWLPSVGPLQLYGIEINPYAHDLAQMTVWIGWLQWIRLNGFSTPPDPLLQPMSSNFQCRDAIIDLSVPEQPKEPEWPTVDFIIGNPPFLGTKKLRSQLGNTYVEALFRLYGERIPNFSDLCCYWFEKARACVERGQCRRAGLLGTQGIRGGLNREVLKRIKETGDIFWAVSDTDWILDGANVHVSLIGFDDGAEESRTLDGESVATINPNLTANADTTAARQLAQNAACGFIADVKAGKFDLSEWEALALLQEPNPHGRPNSDVLLPWINSTDVLRRNRWFWIIDFGVSTTREEAALYDRPFRIVEERVCPERARVQRERYGSLWWLHARPCPEMRKAIAPHDLFIATPTVSKHRLFVWWSQPTLPDHQLVVFGKADACFFGILHSRAHEIWALAQGTQLRERESGFRYTPTTCFETFPFPEATPEQSKVIADAARELNGVRTRWLNPPEWTKEEILEFPGTVGGPWDRHIVPQTVEDRGGFKIATVRYSRLIPRDDASAKQLQKRTLTNLYNQRPAWLDAVHKKLDAGVFAAYGWKDDLSNEEIVERLLVLNMERTQKHYDSAGT